MLTRRTPLGASAGNRTPLTRLATWRSTNEPHPRTYGAEYGSPSASHWFGRPEPKALGQLRLDTLILMSKIYLQRWSGRLDSNQRDPASEAGKIDQTPLRPVVKMVGTLGLEPR